MSGQAGLLTYPPVDAFPPGISDSGLMTMGVLGITVAGSVPDLHRIPY